MNEHDLKKGNEIELKVYDLLKTVIDPELGINIVDLGLIYQIESDENNVVNITMTFSTKDCPMGDMILQTIMTVLNDNLPDVKHKINLTFEPKWTSDFLTPEGRKQLGITE